MLLGEILFVLAALTIAGATAVGLVIGVARLVLFKVIGRKLAPEPPAGSADWAATTSVVTVDLTRESLLTERRRTTKDPIVQLAGVRYRVTRLGSLRFLVTQADEAKRVGTFELDGEGRKQQVIAEPDDPGQAKLISQIAVLSSLVRSSAA
jgi:hypothetical protein